MPFHAVYYFGFCAMLLLAPSLLSARDITQPDYSSRVPFEGDRLSAPSKTFERNSAIAEKRFPVTEWHARYSTIGRQRANIEMTAREREVLAHRTLSFDRITPSVSRFDGRQAYLRNLDDVERSVDGRVLEDARVRRFDGPMREIQADLGGSEDLSLGDLNRFFYMRNRPGADGSGPPPVQQPGGGQ
jgi:hypothetical protein